MDKHIPNITWLALDFSDVIHSFKNNELSGKKYNMQKYCRIRRKQLRKPMFFLITMNNYLQFEEHIIINNKPINS